MEIIFATHNHHKSKEIKAMVKSIATIKNLDEVGLTEEIPENSSTLRGNALEKALYVHNINNKPVFADDTGFEVEALGGRPGVLSARFAGEPKNDKKNLAKVLELMKGENNRKAQFRTVICYIEKDQPVFFEGVVKGKIIKEPRGKEGFGYDPAFIPDGYNETFAEMTLEQKNQLSHRAMAFKRFTEYLEQNMTG